MSTTTRARRVPRTTSFGVVDDLVERHRQRRRVPLDDHGDRIADQNGVDAGRVEDPGPE